ncbi:MAG: DUF3667 domain-containing protein, partial [Alphaproteobacteria bacterium]
MIKSFGNQVKGYFLLLRQRQVKKPKTKKRWLSKKPRKPKFTLDTQGKSLEEIGRGFAQKVEMGKEARPGRAKKGVFHEFCLNCGEKMSGKFCYNCGQKDTDFRRPYWTFLEDISDNLFTRDSKFWRTMGYLLFLPGAMTRDVIQGKRIRYLPPIRLFLVSIIMFFLIVSVFNVAIIKMTGEPITYEDRLSDLTQRQTEAKAELAVVDAEDVFEVEDLERDLERAGDRLVQLDIWRGDQLERADQDAVRKTEAGDLIYDYSFKVEMFSEISEDDQYLPEDFIEEEFEFDDGDNELDFWIFKDMESKLKRGLKNAARDPTRLNNALNNWVPIIMAIFIPLTAIFLRFYYWKREHYIFNHLVFSLHFHTYIFFILIFFVLAQVFLG